MHKITNNPILNRSSTPISTNLVGVYPRNIYTKFKANPCLRLREVKNGILYIVTYRKTLLIYMLYNYPEVHKHNSMELRHTTLI